jgi:hypothetical protein
MFVFVWNQNLDYIIYRGIRDEEWLMVDIVDIDEIVNHHSLNFLTYLIFARFC